MKHIFQLKKREEEEEEALYKYDKIFNYVKGKEGTRQNMIFSKTPFE